MQPTDTKANLTLQRGYTLIELMIALTLGLILLSGLIQVFQGSKKSYKFSTELSRMQENARYALDIVTHDIRMIGYQGCADPENIIPNVIADPPPAASTTIAGLLAFKVTSTGIQPSTAFPSIYTDGTLKNRSAVSASSAQAFDISAYALPYTDIIMMQFMNPVGMGLSKIKTPSTAQITLDSNALGFQSDDIIIVSDCESVDIFRCTGVANTGSDVNVSHGSTNNSGSTAPKLSKPYGANANVLRFETNVYFIAPSGKARDTASTRTNERGDTINSLYRADIKNRVDELVQGVDAMVFLYGEQLADGNVHYYSANDPALDLAKVKSIKVGLLMSSIEAVSDKDDTATYNVAGTNFTPTGTVTYDATDHRLRRVFSETVNLRNRR